MLMTEGAKEIQFARSRFEELRTELVESKEKEREEARDREVKLEERFLSMLEERDSQSARALSAARAADNT